MAIDVQIRWLIRRDHNEILRCEWTASRTPWTEEDYLSWLRQRNCIGMVAVHNEMIVGGMVYELHKSRLHLLRLIVHQEWQRCGVGTAMVERLLGKLSIQRRRLLTADVPDDLLGTHLFLQAMGFTAEAIDEQTYRFTYELRTPVGSAAGVVHKQKE